MTVEGIFLDPDKFKNYLEKQKQKQAYEALTKNMTHQAQPLTADLPAPRRPLPTDERVPFPMSLFPKDNFMKYCESERPNIRQLTFKSPDLIEKQDENLAVFTVSGVLSVWTPIEEGLLYAKEGDECLTKEILDTLTKPERFSFSLNKAEFIGANGRKNGKFKDIHSGHKYNAYVCVNSVCVSSNAIMKKCSNLSDERMVGAYIPFTLHCSTNLNTNYFKTETGGRELAELFIREITRQIRWSFADTFHCLVPVSVHTWSEITGSDYFYTKEILVPMSVPIGNGGNDVWDEPSKNARIHWVEQTQTKKVFSGFAEEVIKLPLTMEPHVRGIVTHKVWGQMLP